MARSFRLLVLLALAIGSSVGCVRCRHKAFAESLCEIEKVPVIAPARAKVYTFLMNGSDLFELGGLSELREKLAKAGFSKLYYAQRPDREWYRRELHRLHRDDPEARFVIVGYGTAADQVIKLIHQVTEEGIPIEAVVFLDPSGVNTNLSECVGIESIAIRSHNWKASRHFLTTKQYEVQGVGHLSLPCHESTVGILRDLLTSIAMKVPVPVAPGACPPIGDKPNPIPRPDLPMRIPVAPPEWRFLCPADGSGIANCLQSSR